MKKASYHKGRAVIGPPRKRTEDPKAPIRGAIPVVPTPRARADRGGAVRASGRSHAGVLAGDWDP